MMEISVLVSRSRLHLHLAHPIVILYSQSEIDRKLCAMCARLFRFKDRRLMYWKKDILDFEKAIDSSAKYILDLTHLISLSFDKKHDLVFTIRHPLLDLDLRFKTNELFMSWLKVLSSFSYTKIRNGPKIETSIPSNYSYSIWNILQSLYTHPSLTKVEGIFRITGNKAERSIIFNNLLQQTYDVQKLQSQSNIHILANILSALLSNLPSTIFREQQLGHLIQFYDAISHRTQPSTTNLTHLFKKQTQNNVHPDQEVADISIDILSRLKGKIEELYYNEKDKSRYGLMTLIFHLLKQIVIHQQRTKMTAENISRIFVHVLESKIFLIKCTDPVQMYRMQFLLKTLIYHAYFLFPHQKWDIEDIVVASKGEVTMIYKICQLRKKRKIKPPSRVASARALNTDPHNNTKFISHFKNPAGLADTESKYNMDMDDEVMSVISATRTERFDDDGHLGRAKKPLRKSRHTRYNSDTQLMVAKPNLPFQSNMLVMPSATASALLEDTESDAKTLVNGMHRMPHKRRPEKLKPLPQAPHANQWKRNGNKSNKSSNNHHGPFHGATLESPRRLRADGVSQKNKKKQQNQWASEQLQHKKQKKKKFKRKRSNAQTLRQSDIPPPPPPPPRPPPVPHDALVSAAANGYGVSGLFDVITGGVGDRKREGTIITPATSCCTLLGCSCTSFMESTSAWDTGECMFCNHSRDAHKARIWM
eukprot:657657_1